MTDAIQNGPNVALLDIILTKRQTSLSGQTAGGHQVCPQVKGLKTDSAVSRLFPAEVCLTSSYRHPRQRPDLPLLLPHGMECFVSVQSKLNRHSLNPSLCQLWRFILSLSTSLHVFETFCHVHLESILVSTDAIFSSLPLSHYFHSCAVDWEYLPKWDTVLLPSSGEGNCFGCVTYENPVRIFQTHFGFLFLVFFSCFSHTSTSLLSPFSFCFTRTIDQLWPPVSQAHQVAVSHLLKHSRGQFKQVAGCLGSCLPSFGLNAASLDKQLHLCFSVSCKTGKRLQL